MYLLKDCRGYIETETAEHLNQELEYIHIVDIDLRERVRNSFPLIKIINEEIICKEKPIEKKGYDLFPNEETFEWEYVKQVDEDTELEQRISDLELVIAERIGG